MTTPGTRPVLVVDFGAQYAQLIARRVREARVYSEVVPSTITAAEVKEKNPVALVLSGGPSSVYEEGAPQLDKDIFELGLPIFGICYGFQVMTQALGGKVEKTGAREYGRTAMKNSSGILHAGLAEEHSVWMSHGDSVTEAPEGFEVTASTPGAPVAAFENAEKRFAGVQYHPEVMHSPHGQLVLTRFLTEIAGLEQNWTASNIAEQLIEQVREQVGENGRAICGLSGGV
ncbi:glutamine-hydrolyzing GMP synthase, partial [Corynebacterium sp.]